MNPRPDDIFEALLGQTIPGGCSTCDAEQTVTRDPGHPRVFRVRIAHDDWCPTHPAKPSGRPRP